MRFADKLKHLMEELNLNQTEVCRLAGINNSSLSQYLSGHNEPRKERRQELARALGVQEGYFDELLPTAQIQPSGVYNLPAQVAAKLMGKSLDWLYAGLQQGVFPWGYAVKLKDWSYFISSEKFQEATGIDLSKAEL